MSFGGTTIIEDRVCAPKVNNIKIRLVVLAQAIDQLKKGIERLNKSSGEKIGDDRKRLFKKHHNFVVFRNSFVFIIFANNGTVNITGINSFDRICEALQNFHRVFGIGREEITDVIVDNVSANGDFGRIICLRDLKHLINEQENEEQLISAASFNVNYFPAVFCKTFSIGTILVFNSGKFNIVGAKCQSHVTKIYLEMIALIDKL